MQTNNDCSKPFVKNFVALIKDKQLTSTNREVFSKIYSLTKNEDHTCYASDAYLADFFLVSPSTIQKSINKLKKHEYIFIEHKKPESGYGPPKRMITINEDKLIYTSNE